MDKEKASAIGAIIGMVLVVPLVLMDGFILQKLWEWFVIPLGVMPLTMSHAVGISVIFGLLTHQGHEDNRSTTEKIFSAIAHPMLAFFIGFIAHQMGK